MLGLNLSLSSRNLVTAPEGCLEIDCEQSIYGVQIVSREVGFLT